MKKAKLVLGGVAVLSMCWFGSSCSSKPACSKSSSHSWGSWTNVWDKENHYGYMKQERYCDACGLRETRVE